MASKYLIPVAAGTVALGLIGSLALAQGWRSDDVVLSVEGETTQMSVRQDTVAGVLEEAGVEVGDKDVVQPSVETKVVDGMEITVLYGKPLELVVDGEKVTKWTTASNVTDALAQLNLNDPNNVVSTSRSLEIGREGLAFEVVTAKDVLLTAAGETSKISVAGTVADALTKAGIKPDKDDIVKPALTTELADGDKISFVKVEKRQITKDAPAPFKKKTEKTSSLNKGKTKVKVKGVNGTQKETYAQVLHDGKVVSNKLVKTEITKAPVDQVTLVGTKRKAAPAGDVNPGANLSRAKGATCKASYYWQGQRTANGEYFNPSQFTAAHKSLPFNSRVKVTNLSNGKTTVVRINDRGPYISGRCLDLSRAAMRAIGGTSAGVIRVSYEVL